mgnify:CR=1 FL=1
MIPSLPPANSLETKGRCNHILLPHTRNEEDSRHNDETFQENLVGSLGTY